MRIYVKRLTVSVMATIAFVAAVGTGVSLADDGTTPSDPGQLLDVSKQVSGIQNQMNQLIAHGQAVRQGKLSATADCGSVPSSQVFLQWGDPNNYSLVPQGDFSITTGWTLNKQATVVGGADPFSGAGQSLQLGNGADAATPAMCVNVSNPTIRFFTRDQGGNGKSNLKVDVLYEDFGGNVKHLTVARLKAGDQWAPSLIVPMYMNMLAQASPTGLTAVAFEFKAEGLQKNETLSISSLYVDPYLSK
jgi:hypothetical protein